MPSALLLSNCHVLYADDGTLSCEPRHVLILDENIASIDLPIRTLQAPVASERCGMPAAAKELLFAGAARQPVQCEGWTVQSIDCGGLTLMPGELGL